ncbi:MAG: hypothetical protein EZS28_027459, partial [Streblomastix strix]
MEKERQIEFDKKHQAKNQQQLQPQQLQIEKDPEINENQIERRSELKKPISLIQSDLNTQANQNINSNYICPLHNSPYKSFSPHPQQYSPEPPLEETIAILRTISSGDPRGHNERESKPKQQKLQQYADQSSTPLSQVPSATILSIQFVNCSWSSFSISDSTISCGANVIRPITASGIALVARSIGRGIVVVAVLTSIVEGA